MMDTNTQEITMLLDEYNKEQMFRFLYENPTRINNYLDKIHSPLHFVEIWKEAKSILKEVVSADVDGLKQILNRLNNSFLFFDGKPYHKSMELSRMTMMCAAHMLYHDFIYKNILPEQVPSSEIFSIKNPVAGEIIGHDETESKCIYEPEYILRQNMMSVLSGHSASYFGRNFQEEYYTFMNNEEGKYKKVEDVKSYIISEEEEDSAIPQQVDEDAELQQTIQDYVNHVLPAVKEEKLKVFNKVWTNILNDNAILQKLKKTRDYDFKRFSKHAIYRIIGRMYDCRYFKDSHNTKTLDRLLEPDNQKNNGSKYRNTMSGHESMKANEIADTARKYYRQ